MRETRRELAFRDATLREGQDTPGVSFDAAEALAIARELERAGVAEAEIVAPGRVIEDLPVARGLRDAGLTLCRSGLIYAAGEWISEEIDRAGEVLDRVDLIMPMSEHRPPVDRPTKRRILLEGLDRAQGVIAEVGVGFPNSTQVELPVLVEIAAEAAAAGATRVTVYDTNGSADPSQAAALVSGVTDAVGVPVYYHGHNDLGLATANSFAAAQAGAEGLDVTVNGLGDRAGNASLEQLVLLLHLRGFDTGIDPACLVSLSRTVARVSGVAVYGLAPVVGEFVFAHRSPGHLQHPTLFEAFNPEVVGSRRSLLTPPGPRPASESIKHGNE